MYGEKRDFEQITIIIIIICNLMDHWFTHTTNILQYR
jgi:hypothetical protein